MIFFLVLIISTGYFLMYLEVHIVTLKTLIQNFHSFEITLQQGSDDVLHACLHVMSEDVQSITS